MLQREVNQCFLLATDAEMAFYKSPIPRREIQSVQCLANYLDLCLFVSILEQLLPWILQQRSFNSAGQLEKPDFGDKALAAIVAQRERSLCLAEQVLAGTAKHFRQGGS